jgi:type VI secretion system protein ImpA
MQALVGKFLAKRGAVVNDAPAGGAAPPEGATGSVRFATGGGPLERQGIAMDGTTSEIRTHEDVMAVLEAVCRYYERYEPSSPVPLMLKATRRLIGKNFGEIMKILTPELIGQIATIGSSESVDAS